MGGGCERKAVLTVHLEVLVDIIAIHHFHTEQAGVCYLEGVISSMTGEMGDESLR
jgi:hypothetical protein